MAGVTTLAGPWVIHDGHGDVGKEAQSLKERLQESAVPVSLGDLKAAQTVTRAYSA